MDNKLLLAKCITLLYKENLLKEPENSRALIQEAINSNKVKPREIGLGLGNDRDIITALRDTVLDLLSMQTEQSIDKSGLLQRIQIDVGDTDKVYQAVEKGFGDDTDPVEIKKSITNLRRSIEKFVRDDKVTTILNAASSSWNFRREKITDSGEFLKNVWHQLEPHSSLRVKEDPAIVDHVNLDDDDGVRKVFSDLRVAHVESRYYKTGWQGLNRMLQGGIRPGEFWIQAALQHTYKTGMTQTIFNQVALYNKPLTSILGKKPAMIMIAFEDTTVARFQFIVQQLMFTARREQIEVSNFSIEEMQSFVQTSLQVNGFKILFYRVDPTKWSYADFFRFIDNKESEGYSIEFCAIDYLEKMPTTGCNTTGPTGNDILDLFSRVRFFLNTKNIACWTPHQISVDAKKLIRGAVTEDKFVQLLPGKGYFKGTSQLDQIPDGIIFTHKFTRNDKTYLAIQRDRHRISSIVKESYKHMYLEFPDKMPIPDDIEGEDSTLYKLEAWKGNSSDDLFNFN